MNKEKFLNNHGFFLEDLIAGQEAILEKKITEKDILRFSELTGDNNPVHLDDDFAKLTIFKKKIAHGFLSGSLISTVIATKLPGPGSIYLSQTLKFLAPVFVDDTITAKVIIEEINMEKRKIKLLTECFVADKKILTGNAEILVSSKSNI